ncbi:hypothetical protein DY000_02047525 [Brassica cretica]|uniref:non-specific serine/threonine protein kinase n=1 Tax=Brassica cretica TaxID=69181 RepID=A0ABQ7ETF0_BRACR|nr:hypothetical protein DY000_02047525 [Brassica cretica]
MGVQTLSSILIGFSVYGARSRILDHPESFRFCFIGPVNRVLLIQYSFSQNLIQRVTLVKDTPYSSPFLLLSTDPTMWKFKPFAQKEPSGLEGRYLEIGSLKVHVRSVIAEGGFSSVYLAQDTNHASKQYALKHIICHDEESLELVMKEISVLKSLKGHPNVVVLYAHGILDMGRNKKEALLAMEYCGKSLVEVIENRGAGYFEEKQALSIFRDVCNAVFAMHCQSPRIAHSPIVGHTADEQEDSMSIAKPSLSLSRTVLHLCSSSKTNLKRQKILKESKANLKKQKKTERERKKKEDSCCFGCEEAYENNDETIFVKGFPHLRPRDEIKNELSNIFGSCGKIISVFVPMQCGTCVPLGFAFINLLNGKEKALKLNGSYMGGRKLKVMMATDSDEYFGFDDFDGCDLCGGPGKLRSRRPIDFDEVSFELYH